MINKKQKEQSLLEKKHDAITAIQKKLVGKKLTYDEIYSIMDEIAHKRLGNVLTAYFAASGYSKGFSNEELFYLTKAMVETGEKLEFSGIVADKHSIGGVPGTRTTLIVVPVVAAAGFTIPKSSSRSITTPSGTADDMEILSDVTFTKQQIYEIVKKTNGCIVWGGSFNIAPADDVLIQVEQPLLFESYDKILTSIMAKKIAFGSNHIVIDIPYGETVKVHRLSDAKVVQNKFEYLAGRFHVKIKCVIHKTDEPFGRGTGPILETRDAMRVLQQKKNRPLDLEIRSLNLAGNLLELCLQDSPDYFRQNVKALHGNGIGWATDLLKNGKAFEKMKEIIKAQNGNSGIDSENLKPGKFTFEAKANKNGTVTHINSQHLTAIARILGAPNIKEAGIYLDKKIGEKVLKNETICTLYGQSLYNVKEAQESIKSFPITEIV